LQKPPRIPRRLFFVFALSDSGPPTSESDAKPGARR